MNSKLLSAKKLCFLLSQTLVFLILIQISCKNKRTPLPTAGYHLDGNPFFNWNIFFGTSTNGKSRSAIESTIEGFVNNYVHNQSSTAQVLFHWSSCPCDTLLANLDATIVNTSGDNINPPPTQPRPGGSGDYSVTPNIDIEIPEASRNNFVDSINNIPLNGGASNNGFQPNGQLLTVIDTGLDTSLIKPSVRNLIWTDPKGVTLFDFGRRDGLGNLSDDNKVKHGTAATVIALLQFNGNSRPKIMALKAFDSTGKGSIYTVSCALSYAIQNHATLINASWGYYGEADSVLYSYLKRAEKEGIPIIAAAGNTKEPPPHNQPLCSDSVNQGNHLLEKHVFYPACFSPDLTNLITVTGVNGRIVGKSSSGVGVVAGHPNYKPDYKIVPCFYQNYSDSFVSVGVLNGNPNTCCEYKLPFLSRPIEGSSFATPVVAGTYLEYLTTHFVYRNVITPNDVINAISQKTPIPPYYTKQGRYLIYLSK